MKRERKIELVRLKLRELINKWPYLEQANWGAENQKKSLGVEYEITAKAVEFEKNAKLGS